LEKPTQQKRIFPRLKLDSLEFVWGEGKARKRKKGGREEIKKTIYH